MSEICEPGQNIKEPVSICSTITPPLHFEVIFPVIDSFFSYALTNLSHPLIFCAFDADTNTSPFLSSIFSNSTDIFSPTCISTTVKRLFPMFSSLCNRLEE